MRKKKRIRFYFGVVICFTLLGYYKYQSKKFSDWPVINETQSPWNSFSATTQITDSVIHRGTSVGAHSSAQQTVAIVNQIKGTTVHQYTKKENLNMSLLQCLSNVSSFLLLYSI